MDRLSFVLVPYLPVEKSFTFANYQFLPLADVSQHANGAVLESANIIAEQHRTQRNQPIKTVTFVYPIGKQLGEYLDDTVIADITEMLRVLYLDGFCHMGQLQVVTAENFEPVFYTIRPNEYTLSTSAGGIFPIQVFGDDIRQISYTAPPITNKCRRSINHC